MSCQINSTVHRSAPTVDSDAVVSEVVGFNQAQKVRLIKIGTSQVDPAHHTKALGHVPVQLSAKQLHRKENKIVHTPADCQLGKEVKKETIKK